MAADGRGDEKRTHPIKKDMDAGSQGTKQLIHHGIQQRSFASFTRLVVVVSVGSAVMVVRIVF